MGGAWLEQATSTYISARVVGSSGFQSEVYDEPPWPEDDKIVADELGPYLAGLDADPT